MSRIKFESEPPIEAEINGKVFRITKFVDKPMSETKRVAEASAKLQNAKDDAEQVDALVEFIQLSMPEFTRADYDTMTGRQVNRLVEILGEGLASGQPRT